MATPNPIRILIADDNNAVRDVLTLLLGTEPDLALVGTARDGKEAVELCCALQPDVILMDLAMPVMDGMQAIGAIRAAKPKTKVILLTNANPASIAGAAPECTPDAFLTKHQSIQQVFGAIRDLVQGYNG